MLQHPIQLNNFVGSGKGTASRGMPAGMGSSAGRGNTAHQRSGTGRSTRALGLEGLGGGAVAGAAEAAVKLQDKVRALSPFLKGRGVGGTCLHENNRWQDWASVIFF